MTTTTLKTRNHAMATSVFERLAISIETAPERLLVSLFTWQTRISDRRHLRGLDNRMLVDIGLNRADVEREAGKPFWQS